MKKINKNWREFLINEAGLNKIRQDMSDYDTAFITAFRGDINDKSICVYVPPSEEELAERDKMGKRGETNKPFFSVKVMVLKMFKDLILRTLDRLTQKKYQEK